MTITKVDFKTLDRFSIKPLGIYGCKDEIVRMLQSIGAVDDKLCVTFVPSYLFCLNCPSGLTYCSHQAMLMVPNYHPAYILLWRLSWRLFQDS